MEEWGWLKDREEVEKYPREDWVYDECGDV